MLVIVHKPCYVPHKLRITTWGTIFTKRLFSVFKERVIFWSHIYLITYDKTLTEKLLAVRPEKVTRKKKRIKRTRGNCKAFCVKHKCSNILNFIIS